ncbi:MAG: TraB/GumN family protein [Bacteroidia bacterium]|nr:TraB/GumN family protein [Bacteroidia bacterium]
MARINTLLWKLQRNNDLDSYLFGTMHIAEGIDIEGLDIVKDLIRDCGLLANEMDLGHSHLMVNDAIHMSEPLSSLIGAKKYQKLREILRKAFQLELDAVQYLKPLIVTNMIAEIILGKSGRVGLDHYLYEFAKSEHIPTTGIEDVVTQAEIMLKIPLEFQVKSLISIGKNVSSFRKQVIGLSRLYQEKNLQELHKKAKRSLGKMRKVLLYDRNVHMAETIYDMIRDQSCFIAIGAGHLYGQKGVLRLLKKKGVAITPVQY